jgi:hypothetical protein
MIVRKVLTGTGSGVPKAGDEIKTEILTKIDGQDVARASTVLEICNDYTGFSRS